MRIANARANAMSANTKSMALMAKPLKESNGVSPGGSGASQLPTKGSNTMTIVTKDYAQKPTLTYPYSKHDINWDESRSSIRNPNSN
jgi:hypothetical protein